MLENKVFINACCQNCTTTISQDIDMMALTTN